MKEDRLKMAEMVSTLRLLIPDKKGIYKRITAAVQEGGGQIKHSRLKKQMRGRSEEEIDITYGNDSVLPSIMSALGRIPGVALIGAPTGARRVVPAGAGSASDKAAPDPVP